MTFCEVEYSADGKTWTCPHCKRTARRPPGVPFRKCRGIEATPPFFNDLSRGPCIHRGETLRRDPCQFCGHKHESVEVFRCGLLAIETSERRFRFDQPRKETCEGCDAYEPA